MEHAIIWTGEAEDRDGDWHVEFAAAQERAAFVLRFCRQAFCERPAQAPNTPPTSTDTLSRASVGYRRHEGTGWKLYVVHISTGVFAPESYITM